MLEILQEIDVSIFNFVNQKLSNSVFDTILPLFREKLFWIPLYVFLLALTVVVFRKSSYIIIVTSLVCVLFADQFSSSFMKPTFERTRPCNEVSIDAHVLAPCGQSFSFTSSHATNHFAVASFFFFLLGVSQFRWRYLLFIWAGLVSLSQVYVGLHYPFDILVGGLFGLFIGWVMFLLLQRFYLRPIDLKK